MHVREVFLFKTRWHYPYAMGARFIQAYFRGVSALPSLVTSGERLKAVPCLFYFFGELVKVYWFIGKYQFGTAPVSQRCRYRLFSPKALLGGLTEACVRKVQEADRISSMTATGSRPHRKKRCSINEQAVSQFRRPSKIPTPHLSESRCSIGNGIRLLINNYSTLWRGRFLRSYLIMFFLLA